ncbi:MAG: AlbA family DNA-binding domain-containing protein [Chloroflexota bacterium]
MAFSDKTIELITKEDLEMLVNDGVREGRSIDYKESLPGSADSDKKEFLADVSSFANTVGGDLLIGVKEQDGVASDILGLEGIDVDAQISRLENIILNGIEPRIPNIHIGSVSVSPSSSVLIIRIPRSFARPHMIKFQEWSRFYSRHSNGKHRLDVSEIRSLFALSDSATERIRGFRIQRLAAISARETPIEVTKEAKLVLHLIPLSLTDPSSSFDVSLLSDKITILIPISDSFPSLRDRYNFDGLLVHAILPDHSFSPSYLQVFRNGSIEAVLDLRYYAHDKYIPGGKYEQDVLRSLPRFLSAQQQLGVRPPILIMLSLLGVSGYAVASPSFSRRRGDLVPIDRDSVIIPEVVVETFNPDYAMVMRPVFDAVWNAGGWPRSMNYDSTGKWIDRRS